MKRNGFFVLLYVLVFAAVYVFCAEAYAQGLVKIADNVYSYVDVKNASPQNSFGANAGIVVGRDGILVIDTLISAKEAQRFIKDIRAVSDKPVKYVVNTHYHLDHTFGNAEFEKLGAVIISHSADRDNMKKSGEATLKNAKGYGLSEADMEGTGISYPTLSFSDKMDIDLGGQTVELMHAGPSHTGGSIIVYLPEQKILFTGDILFTEYHPFIADGDIKGWLKALDRLLKLDFRKIIPGHGPISGRHDLREMKEYLVAFDKKARALSAKSKDVGKIAAELKKALPERPELQSIIQSNVQMKYMKK